MFECKSRILISEVNLAYRDTAKCPYYRGVLILGVSFKRGSTVDFFRILVLVVVLLFLTNLLYGSWAFLSQQSVQNTLPHDRQ